MSDVDAPVKLQPRDVLGKGLAGLRSGGSIPAVIHNHGQESVHVMGHETELLKFYRLAGKHHPLNLQVGDTKFLALIKDAHFDPVKRRLLHIVFQAIRQNETVEAEVPIRIEGEIPAEKVGLIVLHQLDTVHIEALPKNLPDELVVSGESLVELHDKITVEDLTIPDGIKVLTEPDHPIATIAESRAQAAEDAEAEETEAEAADGNAEAGEAEAPAEAKTDEA